MMTYEQFDKAFPTDDACKEYIVVKRWPDGVRPALQSERESLQAESAVPMEPTIRSYRDSTLMI
jgi:hypothetical protein